MRIVFCQLILVKQKTYKLILKMLFIHPSPAPRHFINGCPNNILDFDEAQKSSFNPNFSDFKMGHKGSFYLVHKIAI